MGVYITTSQFFWYGMSCIEFSVNFPFPYCLAVVLSSEKTDLSYQSIKQEHRVSLNTFWISELRFKAAHGTLARASQFTSRAAPWILGRQGADSKT